MDITTKDAKELLEQFAKSPHRSRDGHLNEEGFVELMGGQCEDKEHLKRLFQVIDTHGHGHVDFREYVGGEGKREERRELTRFAQIRALRRRS
jgi:Ca2+-binding EF-hand superfamily protein